MVSPPHEAMHRIFQEHPELFTRISGALGLDITSPSSVTVMSADLTVAREPVERWVDTLLRFDYDRSAGQDPFLLAVESQHGWAPDKSASWACCLSYLFSKYAIRVLLLIVCQDRALAEWAAMPVSLSPRQWPTLTLHPLVVGPHNMPVITDPDEARADLPMATLSAITHAKDPHIGDVLKALTTALQDAPEAVAYPLIECTTQGLGGNHRAAELWRHLVVADLSFCKSRMSEENRDQRRAEARVQTAAEDIQLVLDARGLDVPDEVRERVTACDDPDLMRRWLARAATVASAEEIFAEADA
ncbi:hypothetical protein QF026_003175 [Streptomyces aurantiacus]|uniref:hypothetical protein n=1 Tax=Streptomyces aurantiacus TaxID=47760 RepID=UPI002793071E|nr:hypothetical protein [Streptomyces aurantiacus]MDQ0774709.1 hypothetical protein [Streptomyces aurantiacus]